jgi:hypothetical protein
MVSRPSLFARYAPITPVKIIHAIVGKTPIVFPENNNRPISAAGIRISNNRM